MSWAVLRLDSVWCSAGESAVAGCEISAARGWRWLHRRTLAGLGLAIEIVEIGASLLRWSEDVGRLVSLGYAGAIVGERC